MNQKSTQQYIEQTFTNIILDYPWEDSPDYFVYRHADNHKWFALFMTVQPKSLHLDGSQPINILNLKSDPELIEELIHQPGFLPAYHMNKSHWLTIILNKSAPAAQVQDLINLSFELTT